MKGIDISIYNVVHCNSVSFSSKFATFLINALYLDLETHFFGKIRSKNEVSFYNFTSNRISDAYK